LLLLASEKGLTSKRQIWDRIRGTKSVKVSALSELIENGVVTERDGLWRLSSEVGQ
jgi:hypothetical protein